MPEGRERSRPRGSRRLERGRPRGGARQRPGSSPLERGELGRSQDGEDGTQAGGEHRTKKKKDNENRTRQGGVPTLGRRREREARRRQKPRMDGVQMCPTGPNVRLSSGEPRKRRSSRGSAWARTSSRHDLRAPSGAWARRTAWSRSGWGAQALAGLRARKSDRRGRWSRIAEKYMCKPTQTIKASGEQREEEPEKAGGSGWAAAGRGGTHRE